MPRAESDGGLVEPQTVGAKALALGALASLASLLALAAVVAGLGGASVMGSTQTGVSLPISALARTDIPPWYLALYQAAARRYGLDWAVLAAIGKVECDHGRDPDPSCLQEGAVNRAGAGGTMQFLAATWTSYAVDGNGDGRVDRWNPADAIFTAARFLRASGAPRRYTEAVFAYNHAAWYVREVMSWAARYRGGALAGAGRYAPGPTSAGALDGVDPTLAPLTSTPVLLVAGVRAVLAPSDGHLALIPADAPQTVRAMLVAGNELQDLAYGPRGHPDPRGSPEEDCSSTLNYVLYRAGVRPIAEIVRQNPLAQDYVHWGLPGPGRWVTIYAATTPSAHVFVVIAGLRLDTSHAGTDVGPNRFQDGPRWRVLERIPTWARWSLRHPPGL